MNDRQSRGGFGGFDPEQIFGPGGPFGQQGFFGPGGVFGGGGPFADRGGWAGPGRGPGHRGPRPGRRARRGDVRNAVLHLLGREPMNGYQLMQAIAEETDGAWQPSSGAIYPALAQLEDEGLIEPVQTDGRKAYQLTPAGQDAAAKTGPGLGFGAGAEPEDPWAGAGRGRRRGGHGSHGPGRRGTVLLKSLGGVAMAAQAVGQAGDDQLTTEAGELLDRTRRELYRLLAEAELARDDDHDPAGDPDGEIAEGEIIED